FIGTEGDCKAVTARDVVATKGSTAYLGDGRLLTTVSPNRGEGGPSDPATKMRAVTELTRSERTSRLLVARLDALATVASQISHVEAERLGELASIGQPAPLVIALSISSGVTPASSSTRTQSFNNGMRMRLTMNPGVSLHRTGCLPACSAQP